MPRSYFPRSLIYLFKFRFAALAVAIAALPLLAQARSLPRQHESLAAAPGTLPPSVRAALARAHVPISSFSAVVEPVSDPRPIVAVNATQPMSPASTIKLVTTFAGLSILGAGYRWRTDAYVDGKVEPNGRLRGNLYIVGHGDPKLVPEELTDLVGRIRQAGITAIDGDLILDKYYFDQSTRDAPPFDNRANAPYNVGPDPLLYAFKSLSFTLAPASNGQVAIEIQPQLAQLQLVNTLRATRGPCPSTWHAVMPNLAPKPDGTVQASFRGNYPLRCGGHAVNIAVLDHSAFFGRGFLALWRQAGGTLSGQLREGPTLARARWVASHHGPPLAEVVRDINKFSNNVMARNLFLTIGAVADRPPATIERSVRVIERWLTQTNLPNDGLMLDNGAGLSHTSRISARSLAALLRTAYASEAVQPFIESLPIVGVDGTMRHRLTNKPVVGNAHIKTGTLDGVRAIAGYVTAANGNGYIVVSFINDPHAEAASAAHDRLLEWVYQHAPTVSPSPGAQPRTTAQLTLSRTAD